jgi:hypothetical protein
MAQAIWLVTQEPIVNTFLNTLLNRSATTNAVNRLSEAEAHQALSRRVDRMLALQASQPLPRSREFEPLRGPDKQAAG